MGQRGKVKNRVKGRFMVNRQDSLQTFQQGKTYLGLVKSGEALLEAYGIQNDTRLESELLLSALLKIRRLDLYLKNDHPVDPSLAGQFRAMLDRRGNHEPLQYITGKEFFLNRLFSVGPGVLIPRPETEGLVLEALRYLKEGPFLDLGTGSGCIAISLLLEQEKSGKGFAVDISADSLSYAKENAVSLGVASSLRFFEGDLFHPLPENLKGSFEIIISNPPYLDMEADDIEISVRNFEPRRALDGGAGGLKVFERIFNEAGDWLKPGGILVLEIGYKQLSPLLSLLKNHSCWTVIKVTKDPQGIDRIVSLVFKGNNFG